jgi:hypothetical protein
VTVCLGERARPGSVEHGGNIGSGVVSGVGVERHAVLGDRHTEEGLSVAPLGVCQSFGAGCRNITRSFGQVGVRPTPVFRAMYLLEALPE